MNGLVVEIRLVDHSGCFYSCLYCIPKLGSPLCVCCVLWGGGGGGNWEGYFEGYCEKEEGGFHDDGGTFIAMPVRCDDDPELGFFGCFGPLPGALFYASLFKNSSDSFINIAISITSPPLNCLLVSCPPPIP